MHYLAFVAGGGGSPIALSTARFRGSLVFARPPRNFSLPFPSPVPPFAYPNIFHFSRTSRNRNPEFPFA